jgi:hypothetical protein
VSTEQVLNYLYEKKSGYTVKKVINFPVPSRDVTYQTLPGREYFNYIPPRESLVSDIPAGHGKISKLCFYNVESPLENTGALASTR